MARLGDNGGEAPRRAREASILNGSPEIDHLKWIICGGPPKVDYPEWMCAGMARCRAGTARAP